MVDKAVVKAGVPGSPDEVHVFSLGEAFELPEGYQLAEGVAQITDVPVPYGTVGAYAMIVEKIAEEDPEDPTDPEDPIIPEDPTDPEAGRSDNTGRPDRSRKSDNRGS